MALRGMDRRNELVFQVQEILSSVSDGYLVHTDESQSIDFKEEAGRRRGRELLAGQPTNPEAATKLADEVACMANSPGGGALIVGVEDKTGRLIGTELEVDWLRQEIASRVGVAPDIQAEHVEGFRLLRILVAETKEPIEDTSGRLRWRVGDRCDAVDRSEWWTHRDRIRGFDPMAVQAQVEVDDIRPEALTIVRRWRGEEPLAATDEELLRTIGALRSDGTLSTAAALLLTPLQRTGIELTQFSVPSGQVLNHIAPDPKLSLAEQIDMVEKALLIMNNQETVEQGFRHLHINRVPFSAAREAILNGVIHRDWNRSTPTEVRWTESDSMLEVTSPGGFVGHVTAANVLSQREARYPALADLFRAVGLVDKQGVGVDRMYRAMISVGHTPPIIEENDGAFVHVKLIGGRPVTPVLELMSSLRPEERQEDYRLSILLHHLLYHPFISTRTFAEKLQSSDESARAVLNVALQTLISGEPIITKFHDVWRLGDTALEIVERSRDMSSMRPLVPYRTTDEHVVRSVIDAWLSAHPSITTGDVVILSGVSRGTAKRILDALVDDDVLVPRGKGRASRYERP